MRRTVLIFTVDMIPVPDCKTSGGGLRAWTLGQALAEKGHDVIYSVPKKQLEGRKSHKELNEYAFDPLHLSRVIRKVVPDIILFEQWGLVTYLDETNIPVAIDLHGSLILENHFRHHWPLHSNVANKIKAFAKADFLLCTGERQKHYFLPWSMLSGIPFDEKRIAVIPVSLSPDLPEKHQSLEPKFVFGGGLWPWIDPFPCLHIVAEELKASKKGIMKLFTQKPETCNVLPGDDCSEITAMDLSKLQDNDRVLINKFIPYEKMITEYADASAAVDLYQWNPERELAFSNRTVDYLWCGVPVIHAHYSEISPYIEEYQAGWSLDPNDVDGIRQAVSEILSNSPKVNTYAANAQKLVQDHFVWNKTIDPLDDFVSNPLSKMRKQTFFDRVSLEFDRIEDELEQKNQRNKETLRETGRQLAALQEKHHGDLEGRDKEIWRLNQGIHKFRDQLEALQDEKHKQEVETRELHAKWQTDLQEKRKTIDLLNSEVNALNDQLGARDENIRRLTNSLEDASDRLTYMDGVLKSIQNRLTYRLYKRTTYRLRRWVVQYPKLFYLLILNIFTNTYMSRWCGRKKTRIFPGQ